MHLLRYVLGEGVELVGSRHGSSSIARGRSPGGEVKLLPCAPQPLVAVGLQGVALVDALTHELGSGRGLPQSRDAARLAAAHRARGHRRGAQEKALGVARVRDQALERPALDVKPARRKARVDVKPDAMACLDCYNEFAANELGGWHETFPPQLLASGSGRCRAARHLADRKGTSLCNETGALDRRISAGRRCRHRGSDHGPMVVGTARPASHYRKPARCRQQHCRPSGRQFAARWIHAAVPWASAVVNTILFENLPFNLHRDIAPVSGLIDYPMVMIAHPSVPARTVAEVVAYAKAN